MTKSSIKQDRKKVSSGSSQKEQEINVAQRKAKVFVKRKSAWAKRELQLAQLEIQLKELEIDTQVKIKRKWRVKLENSQGAIIDNEAKKVMYLYFLQVMRRR